jgi:hypothetical protein
MIANFYKNLFASNAGGRIDELLQHIHPRVVSMVMNESLMQLFI